MIDDETIAAAKAEHGSVTRLVGAGEDVLVRQPTRADWARFRKQAAGSKRHIAAETLFLACCVHPRGKELDELLERHPAAAESFVEALLKLAGVDPDVKATNL